MKVSRYNPLGLTGMILFVLMSVSCSKEKMPDITGEWKLDNISTVTKGNTYGINVYLEFDQDGTFSIWQQRQEGLYEYYHGEWASKDNVINGTYDDGKPWGSGSYKAAIKKGNLTLTAQNGTGEVTIYIKTSIPEEVKDSAESALRKQ